MGLYERFVLPHCVQLACGSRALVPYRARAAQPLSGRVLEIGFGSGLNVPHYPEQVSEVLAVDPSKEARRLGRARLAKAPCPVRFVGLDAERIDLADGSVDSVLSTFTLCTIPDVSGALAEVLRVLKPGGLLCFVEHGRSPQASVARWQDRLNGAQRRVGGGCNLNRPIPTLLEDAGFSLRALSTGYLAHAPRTHGFLFEGVAIRGAAGAGAAPGSSGRSRARG